MRRFPLLIYFVLAYLFTWAIELPMMYSARGVFDFHLPLWLEALAAFGPFAAALIVARANYGAAGVRNILDSLKHWRVPGVWLAATILSPFVVMFAALAMSGELGKFFSGELFRQIVDQGKVVEIVLLGAILRGIGEEPGWRGFALPLLRGRYGPLLATLVLWPFWALWHLPAYLMRPDASLLVFLLFSVGILAATFWSTLLYDKTRSILMLAIWHALINITRAIALTGSAAAFMAYNQVTIVLGLIIAVFWLIKRPGPYEQKVFPD